MLTRLSHGHIRIGTFQRLAFFGEVENIKQAGPLLPRRTSTPSSPRTTIGKMRFGCSTSSALRRPTLAASYIAAGFVHGVLNSDNINVTGESFDYGPWRFTPYWDPDFTAAYFDHYGLYAFGRQPEAIHWDVAQLAGCLSLVAEAPPLSDLLAGWSGRFEEALVEAMIAPAWDRAGTERSRRLPPP